MSPKEKSVMSIGALSQATGIPSNTIRTWERRYGFPVAERTTGGHRAYAAGIVPHLELVQSALQRGHRPAQVLRLPLAQLQEMLGASGRVQSLPRSDTPAISAMFEATLALDAGALERLFAAGSSRHGAVAFIEEYAHPFLVSVGEAWHEGRLQIFHEHFASERLGSFLSARWRQAAPPVGHRTIVLATLPGETHTLGLHMVALVATQCGWRPLYLGASTPIADIVQAAADAGAQYVAVSVSAHANPVEATGQLRELVSALPAGVSLIVGGGANLSVEGARQPESLGQLQRWLSAP